eukprot:TRINITY_DN102476_c0_g1_i1.p1 TRINITY_DN102476_c0_g1~~TRINITY_DN102476_c0_g1_i1.p1  ORF type:complete len:347 (-),score=59.12 TRINITY_DN102476_c0_g1_i1:51-1091(-)
MLRSLAPLCPRCSELASHRSTLRARSCSGHVEKTCACMVALAILVTCSWGQSFGFPRQLARSMRIARHSCFEPEAYADYANAPRWDPTAPLFTEDELEDTVEDCQEDHAHACTLVYLHAFGRCGKEYRQPLLDRLSPGFSCPWASPRAGDRAPGLRVVLPTARLLRQPWGPVETSWHAYTSPDSNDVGDRVTLLDTRKRLAALLRDEISLLGGRADRVFLGGLSQGCTAALDVYLCEGAQLGLGGFVGSVGFWPSDGLGFAGANEAMKRLKADREQSWKPVWLQSALDDQWVPWQELVRPSLEAARGGMNLPGLEVKTVSGRGHVIDQWEGDWLHAFVSAHAPEAF